MKVYYFSLVHLLVMIDVRHDEICISVLVNINDSNTLTINVEFLNSNILTIIQCNFTEAYYTHIIIFNILCLFSSLRLTGIIGSDSYICVISCIFFYHFCISKF